jgi:hypothetical protein
MTPEQRLLLYWTVKSVKPASILEIGTHTAQGSTWFIVKALEENGVGHLTSMDCDPAAVARGKQAYPGNQRVGFVLASTIGELRTNKYDMVLFDGGDDPQETFDQFRFVDTKLAVFHDWHDEKCRLVRPLLVAPWEMLWYDGFGVGMAAYRRKV